MIIKTTESQLFLRQLQTLGVSSHVQFVGDKNAITWEVQGGQLYRAFPFSKTSLL
jgi:hypothetical protein